MADEENKSGQLDGIEFKLEVDSSQFVKDSEKAFQQMEQAGEKATAKMTKAQMKMLSEVEKMIIDIGGEYANKIPTQLARIYKNIEDIGTEKKFSKDTVRRAQAKATTLYAQQLAEGIPNYAAIEKEIRETLNSKKGLQKLSYGYASPQDVFKKREKLPTYDVQERTKELAAYVVQLQQAQKELDKLEKQERKRNETKSEAEKLPVSETGGLTTEAELNAAAERVRKIQQEIIRDNAAMETAAAKKSAEEMAKARAAVNEKQKQTVANLREQLGLESDIVNKIGEATKAEQDFAAQIRNISRRSSGNTMYGAIPPELAFLFQQIQQKGEGAGLKNADITYAKKFATYQFGSMQNDKNLNIKYRGWTSELINKVFQDTLQMMQDESSRTVLRKQFEKDKQSYADILKDKEIPVLNVEEYAQRVERLYVITQDAQAFLDRVNAQIDQADKQLEMLKKAFPMQVKGENYANEEQAKWEAEKRRLTRLKSEAEASKNAIGIVAQEKLKVETEEPENAVKAKVKELQKAQAKETAKTEETVQAKEKLKTAVEASVKAEQEAAQTTKKETKAKKTREKKTTAATKTSKETAKATGAKTEVEATKTKEETKQTAEETEKAKKNADMFAEGLKRAKSAAKQVRTELEGAKEAVKEEIIAQAKAKEGVSRNSKSWFAAAPPELQYEWLQIEEAKNRGKITAKQQLALQKKTTEMYAAGESMAKLHEEVMSCITDVNRLEQVTTQMAKVTGEKIATTLVRIETIRKKSLEQLSARKAGASADDIVDGSYTKKYGSTSGYYTLSNLPEDIKTMYKMVDILVQQKNLTPQVANELKAYTLDMYSMGKSVEFVSNYLVSLMDHAKTLEKVLAHNKGITNIGLQGKESPLIAAANRELTQTAKLKGISEEELVASRKPYDASESTAAANSMNQASVAAAKLQASVSTIKQGMGQIVSGFQQMTGHSQQVANATQQQATAQQQASTAATQTNATMSNMKTSAQQIAAGVRNMAQGLSSTGTVLASASKQAIQTRLHYKRLTGTVAKFFNYWGSNTKILSDKMTSSFKKTSRIIQGILVSQAFYKFLSNIKSAVSSVNDMAKSFENAKISFALLMRDIPKSEQFIRALEDFAAVTPFNMESSQAASKKLLAMGFDAKNVLYIMRSITDAAALSGASEENINRLAEAIGKIKTRGYASMKQLTQITAAGIPVFDILQEKLKLTNDQINDIYAGTIKLKADVALPAILEGINDRYGGAAKLLAETIDGMKETITDNLTIIGKELIQKGYKIYSSVVRTFRNLTEKWRETVRRSGAGGLFEELFPPRAQEQIRQLLASLLALGQTMGRIARAVGPALRETLDLLLTALNAILPVINYLLSLLAAMMYQMGKSTKATKIFVGALLTLTVAAKVATAITKLSAAIKGLAVVKLAGKGINMLSKSLVTLLTIGTTKGLFGAWAAGLGVAAAAVLTFALSTERGSRAIRQFGKDLLAFFKINPSDILKPELKDVSKETEDFNVSLGDSTDAANKWADGIAAAGKKAKEGIASFDEVFELPEATSTSGGALDIDDETFEVGEILPENMQDILDNMDLDTWTADFSTLFSGELLEKLQGAVGSISWGAILGGIIGGALGGPAGIVTGMKLGAIAGLIANALFPEITKAFGDPKAWVALGLGTVIGAGLLMALGVPGPIAVALSSVASTIVVAFWEDIVEFFTGESGNENTCQLLGDALALTIGAGVGLILTGGNPLGGVLGAAIGALAKRLLDSFLLALEEQEEGSSIQLIAEGIGGLIGAGIGFAITGGNPIGAALGAGMGILAAQLCTWLCEEIPKKASEVKEAFTIWWDGITTSFTEWWEGLKTTVEEKWNDLQTFFSTWVETLKESFTDKWTEIKDFFKEDVPKALEKVRLWFEELPYNLGLALGRALGHVINFGKDVKDWIVTELPKIIDEIIDWFAKLPGRIWEKLTEAYNKFIAWKDDMILKAGEAGEGVLNKIIDWFKQLPGKISTWTSQTWTNFITWKDDMVRKAGEMGSDFINGIIDYIKSLPSKVATHFEEVKTYFKDLPSEFLTMGQNAIQGWWDGFYQKIEDVKSNIKRFGQGIVDGLKEVLGIHSPSTVFKEIGKNMLLGLQQGIEAESANTEKPLRESVMHGVDLVKDLLSKELNNINLGTPEVAARITNGKGKLLTLDSGYAGDAPNRYITRFGAHAAGGIFYKDHIARLNEGNKAEMVVPLENNKYMQPFVDALSDRISANLASTSSGNGSGEPLRPLYVGTLIADDRSLRELNSKMQLIQLNERRRG